MTVLALKALFSLAAILTMADGIYTVSTHTIKPLIRVTYIIYFQPHVMSFMDATIGSPRYPLNYVSEEKEKIMMATRQQIKQAENEIRFFWNAFLLNNYISPAENAKILQDYKNEIQNNYINLIATKKKYGPCNAIIADNLARLLPNFKPFFFHVPHYTSFALLGQNAIGINQDLIPTLSPLLLSIALQHEYGHQVLKHRDNLILHKAGILKKKLKKDLKNKPMSDELQHEKQFMVNALRKNRRIIFQAQELQADAFAATVHHIKPHHIKALRNCFWDNTEESKRHPCAAVRNHNLDLILKAYAKDNALD